MEYSITHISFPAQTTFGHEPCTFVPKSLLPHTILCQLVVLHFLFQSMEKNVGEQDREIRDMVKRADKNLDRTGAFVCSPLSGQTIKK